MQWKISSYVDTNLYNLYKQRVEGPLPNTKQIIIAFVVSLVLMYNHEVHDSHCKARKLIPKVEVTMV